MAKPRNCFYQWLLQGPAHDGELHFMDHGIFRVTREQLNRAAVVRLVWWIAVNRASSSAESMGPGRDASVQQADSQRAA